MVTSVASSAGDHDAPYHPNGSTPANLGQRLEHAAALLAHQSTEDAELVRALGALDLIPRMAMAGQIE
jgi:hypothetical protein